LHNGPGYADVEPGNTTKGQHILSHDSKFQLPTYETGFILCNLQSPRFVETEGSLPGSQEAATEPYSESDKLSLKLHTPSLHL
jgi:hypothetical protein